MVVRVKLDRAKLDAFVAREVRPGTDRAARLMAADMRQRAPEELRGHIAHESGQDSRGFYARAGVTSDLDPKRWHELDGTTWRAKGWQERRGKPLPFWRLVEFRTKRSQARPFIRPALWQHTRAILRALCGR